MRVISGLAKGHKLFAPSGFATRPTTDKVKESLFNILTPYLTDINFLDLFSGSGAIGIEAISRGALFSVFVEYSKEACDIIKKNLIKTKFEDKSLLLKTDVFCAIKKLNKLNINFDIIFLDPPYIYDKLNLLLINIKKERLLKDDGIIVIEQSSGVPDIIYDGFYVINQKVYKSTTIILLKMQEDADDNNCNISR